jgi:hypothetical protein
MTRTDVKSLHRGVSAVLVVKQLHPAFVGNQRHTIWEHPAPDHTVEALPLWRRSVVGAEGQMEFVDAPRTQATGSASATPGPSASPSLVRP